MTEFIGVYGASGKTFVLQHLEYRMIAEKLENIVFK